MFSLNNKICISDGFSPTYINRSVDFPRPTGSIEAKHTHSGWFRFVRRKNTAHTIKSLCRSVAVLIDDLLLQLAVFRSTVNLA